jgi:putative transposase
LAAISLEKTKVMRSKFTDQRIVFAIKHASTGTPVEELCRKPEISQQTLYRWKKKFAGPL